MAYKKLSESDQKQLEQLMEMWGMDKETTHVHICAAIICDHCEDEEKEAFPYYVKDRGGKEWAHLCNECFDELGCEYDWTYDDLEEDAPTRVPGLGAFGRDWSGVNIERRRRK